MQDMRVAKEIVQVSQDLLVRPDEKEPQIVILTRSQAVHLERVLDVVQVDELINLAITVTGQIRENRASSRLFGEAVQGHHRKQNQ